jgi:hypothetical protein
MKPYASRADPPKWIPFEQFCAQFGRTRQIGHRWMQQLPWLKAESLTILGRLYISAAGAQRFTELATAGQLRGRGYVPPAPPRGPKKDSRKAAARISAYVYRRRRREVEPPPCANPDPGTSVAPPPA